MNIQKNKVISSKVKNVTQFKQTVNEPESSPKKLCLVEILYLKYLLANPAFQMEGTSSKLVL